jgi:hypothetical protein
VKTLKSSARLSRSKQLLSVRTFRELHRLRKAFGHGRWRKQKGIATVRLEDGTICQAELHWYEAHGIGRKKLKIKQYLD